jgi:uncharacterized damage-inducible protein DinB
MLSKSHGAFSPKLLLKGEKMKTIFQALAKYNQSVNQSILELVEPLAEEQIMMKTKAFFPSIFETMFHCLMSDIFWFTRFKDVFKESKALAGSELVSLDLRGLRKEYDPDYKKLFQHRKQADETIRQLIEEIAGDRFGSVVKYKNFKGEEVEGLLWKILLQWFNHQTHHRGQISVFLDMIDVKNDYSSMLNRI